MSNKKLLSREEILARSQLRTKEIYVPAWDAAVRIRELTAAERDYFEGAMLGDGGRLTNYDNVRARLCVLSLVDEEGKRLFRDGEEVLLGSFPAAALDAIFREAMALNGFTEESKAESVKK